ncbi:MAG: prepilin-type N-terminal cleavage/methylation domain-containing protein [Phycisphaerales bacterium]|nr:prepilin-type N-terminal cleavage/methylation domain-containing protein [Phycisphaerales bacterium]
MCQNSTNASRRALTLIELLVTISIIALLIAILMPALSAGRGAAQDLECKTRMRSVTTEFLMFADPTAGVPRGDSDAFGPNVFRIEDFQERMYGIDEFWSGGDRDRAALSSSESSMMCPSARGSLERRSGIPCSSGAIGPQENVSTGFNMRLEEKWVYVPQIDRNIRQRINLTSKILSRPDVPLVFDLDGKSATELGQIPYYSAPPVLSDKITDMYEDGNFWYPALRHNRRMNVGFIGGHVLSSTEPATEPFWRWSYVPE